MRWARLRSSEPESLQSRTPCSHKGSRTFVWCVRSVLRSGYRSVEVAEFGRCRSQSSAIAAAADSERPPTPARAGAHNRRWDHRWKDTSCTTMKGQRLACHAETVARSVGDRGVDRSSRESSAPFGAAVLQNLAASTSLHSGTKPMLFGTTMIIGLKCTLHGVLLRPRGCNVRVNTVTQGYGQPHGVHNIL